MERLLFITPTFNRPNQIDYIKRCISIFSKVENFFWIIIEDDSQTNPQIDELLKQSKISHIYIHYGPTRCFGNAQRNYALEMIYSTNLSGIIYFADDDNMWNEELFEEIRKTKRVSIFPVGNMGPNKIERPIIRNGRIIDWDSEWKERRFPVDMGAFAFHSDILKELQPPFFDFYGAGGETEFLEKFVRFDGEFEILCNNCEECYVWHDENL